MQKNLTPILTVLCKLAIISLMTMVIIATSFFLCKLAFGNSVTLTWDPNSESDLAGYKIYYNNISLDSPFTDKEIQQGASPITVDLQNLSAPQKPSYQINGLSSGKTYFFKLTAYNSSGVESVFSNVVNCKVPEPPAALHKITTSKIGIGSISPSGIIEVVEGKNQTFTIAPESHHYISDVLVDGQSVGIITSYTFSNIVKGHTIEAIFIKESQYLPDETSQSSADNNDATSANYVYVMDYFGFHVIDISDQNHPVNRGKVDVGYVNGLSVSGNYAYMAVDYSVQIVDVLDAGNPVIISSMDMPDWTTSVAVSGNYAYAVGFFGLQIIDIQDLSRPAIISSLNTAMANHITVLNNYAYIAVETGLLVVDVSNPSNPVIISRIDTSWVNHITISNNYAYMAVNYGLDIVDIADPNNPVLIGFADADWANQVEVSDHYAYLAADNGLQIIDISNLNNPVSVSSIDTQDFAYGVALSGKYAYVAGGYSGLLIVNISDPDNPVVNACVDNLGDVRFVIATGSA